MPFLFFSDLTSNDTCTPLWDCVCPDFDMTTGGVCPPGYFCPQASGKPIPCTPGMYCGTPGLAEPTGNCTEGYYCNHTSDVPDQHECPPGAYCPVGTGVPVLCPAGTWSSNNGNNELADCVNCTGGKYCQGDGNVVPDADCTEGYYCPTGIDTPTPADKLCWAGHYCPTGTDIPLVCANGTYTATEGNAVCDPCPPGYYCDPVQGNNNNTIIINVIISIS